MGRIKLKIGRGGSRYPQVQMPGTEVMLAGRKALLPNIKVPHIVQPLTMEQIKAIPTDKYSVTILDMPTKPVVTVDPTLIGNDRRRQRTLRSILQGKRIARFGGGSASRIAREMVTAAANEDAATRLYTSLVSLLGEAKINAEGLYMENRKNTRNGGDDNGDPQQEGLFYAPIDEGLMSDCLIRAKVYFFDEKDNCKLYGHAFKLPEFFLFVYYFFIRIKILKNTARQPFSEYVRKKVLRDENAFTDKTFNNYAKNYEDREQDFTNSNNLDINFNILPDSTKKQPPQLIKAFQEIGHYFLKSDYFFELRKIREQMNTFGI